jgi:hypothetical protein
MKITKRQLRRIIKEAAGKDFFTDREANPHDETMYGEPEGGYDQSHDERDRLMKLLMVEFPLKHVRTTEEFGSDSGGIWLSGESGETMPDGLPIFNYYSGDVEPYEFGVHKDFSEFLGKYDYFAEWHDPGTIMIWKM